MQREKLYTVNPYGKEPNHLDFKYEKYKGEKHFISESHKNKYADNWSNWQEAEQSIFAKWAVLIKND